MADERAAPHRPGAAGNGTAGKGTAGKGTAKPGKPDRAAMVAALAALSVEATSPDGAISVSVNTDGVLTRLRVGEAAGRMSPTEIANAVLRTYSQAQRDSAVRSAELLAPLGNAGYLTDRLRWRTEFRPDLQSAPERPSAREATGASSGHAGSRNPRDARNEYLKDRSVPGYDLVPPIPAVEPPEPADDNWYEEGFRVKGPR